MSCSIGTNTGCHDDELSIVDTSATRTRVGITVQPTTSTVTGGGGGGGGGEGGGGEVEEC